MLYLHFTNQLRLHFSQCQCTSRLKGYWRARSTEGHASTDAPITGGVCLGSTGCGYGNTETKECVCKWMGILLECWLVWAQKRLDLSAHWTYIRRFHALQEQLQQRQVHTDAYSLEGKGSDNCPMLGITCVQGNTHQWSFRGSAMWGFASKWIK